MNVLGKVAAAVAVYLSTSFGVSAATVNINNSPTGDKGVNISCTGLCEFWDLAGPGFSAASGDWLTGPADNSNANRRAFVNSLLSTNFLLQSESSDATSGAPALNGFSGDDNGGWTGSSQYYLAWGGPDPRYILIKNNSFDNMFTWETTGQGSGLSGVDGFGDIAPIPLPATAVLLLAGLGGLAAFRRKRG